MDFVLVSLLESGDISGTLLGLLNLLPRLHLLLLEESNSVGQQLSISLNVLSPLLNFTQRLQLAVVSRLCPRSIHFGLLNRLLGVILWCVRNGFHIVN